MLSGCVYNSKYTPSDGIERNTSYNGVYTVNFLAGKEFNWKNKTIGLGTKVTAAGGKRKGIVDPIASAQQGEVIFQDAGFNEDKFRDYFRADLKFTYKVNRDRATHELGIDLVNILGTKNILSFSYAPNSTPSLNDDVVENYQLGFLPIFYYRIDF